MSKENWELCQLCQHWVSAPGGWPNINGDMCSERMLMPSFCLNSIFTRFHPKEGIPLWKVDRLPIGTLLVSTVLKRHPDVIIVDGLFTTKKNFVELLHKNTIETGR